MIQPEVECESDCPPGQEGSPYTMLAYDGEAHSSFRTDLYRSFQRNTGTVMALVDASWRLGRSRRFRI